MSENYVEVDGIWDSEVNAAICPECYNKMERNFLWVDSTEWLCDVCMVSYHHPCEPEADHE